MASEPGSAARIGYADPPYPGQSKLYRKHPDYAGEVDHRALLERLATYDGWVLHTSTPALPQVLDLATQIQLTYRIAAWVKPFASFKPSQAVAYAWEPVLISEARRPVVSGRLIMRDWIAESITLQRGLAGAKPEAVCRWAFEIVGAQPGDILDDLYPGTGAVTKAWQAWSSETRIDAVTGHEALELWEVGA